MKNLSLTGEFIKLSPTDDEDNELKNVHIRCAIKDIKNEKMIGFLNSYQYNKIDNYAYFSLQTYKNVNGSIIFEASNMFFNYLFTCFPVRKIYFEGNCYCIDIMKELKKIGFKIEANLKKDCFIHGEYCDRYILALYKNDFCEGN